MQKLIALLMSFLILGMAFGVSSVIADDNETGNDSGDSGSGSDDENGRDSDDDLNDEDDSDDDLDDEDELEVEDEGEDEIEDEDGEEVEEEIKLISVQEQCKIRVEQKARMENGVRVVEYKKKVKCPGNETEFEMKIVNDTENGKYREKIKYKFEGRDFEIETEDEIELEEEINGTNYELKARLKNGDETRIKIMPHQASEVALERLRARNFTVMLRESDDRNVPGVIYNIEANKSGRFLGVFKLKLKAEAQVDPETGELLDYNKPWWAFLVSGEDSDQTNVEDEAETITGQGVVQFEDVEGGCWIIVSDGTQYEPTNLADEFKQNGLAVEFEAELETDTSTICQAGTLIEIKTIANVTAGASGTVPTDDENPADNPIEGSASA